MIKLGVIGCGNMGGAILKAWSANRDLSEHFSFYAYDHSVRTCSCEMNNVTALQSEEELVRVADWVLIAVKPQQLPDLLGKIKNDLGPEKLLISIAAGVSIARIKELCGQQSAVIRVMPNMPALVAQGVFGICVDDPVVDEHQKNWVEKMFSYIGEALLLPEEKFNAFTALSGGGPAYIYYFLEALVEAGVTLGITRQEALRMVLALAKGSITLAEGSELSLAELREQVCSPGGTTIEATNHFARTGMRGHIIDAIAKASDKGDKLS